MTERFPFSMRLKTSIFKKCQLLLKIKLKYKRIKLTYCNKNLKNQSLIFLLSIRNAPTSKVKFQTKKVRKLFLGSFCLRDDFSYSSNAISNAKPKIENAEKNGVDINIEIYNIKQREGQKN